MPKFTSFKDSSSDWLKPVHDEIRIQRGETAGEEGTRPGGEGMTQRWPHSPGAAGEQLTAGGLSAGPHTAQRLPGQQ